MKSPYRELPWGSASLHHLKHAMPSQVFPKDDLCEPGGCADNPTVQGRLLTRSAWPVDETPKTGQSVIGLHQFWLLKSKDAVIGNQW